MKRGAILMTLLFVSGLLLSACAGVVAPVTGVLYKNVDAPLAATMASASSKRGESSCSSILGIVATGDASIDAAMRNGGITKIHHVDYNGTSFLGIYATMTTTVYGE